MRASNHCKDDTTSGVALERRLSDSDESYCYTLRPVKTWNKNSTPATTSNV